MLSLALVCALVGCASVSSAAIIRSETSHQAVDDCSLPSFGRWCDVFPTDIDTGGTKLLRKTFEGQPKFTMAVYAGDDIVSKSICDQGSWEHLRSASDIGKPGTALDIGGNIGYYSFLLAHAGWHVETFEPMVRNLELMRATKCRNPDLAKRVNIHEIALGPKNDTCTIVADIHNVGDGNIQCGDKRNLVKDGYKVQGSFAVHRLDDVLASGTAPRRINFVKIDVEGFECQVFKGATDFLRKYKPERIQSEVWSHMIECEHEDYLEMFKNAGYTVAKTRGCEKPDVTMTNDIDDFFMCLKNTTRSGITMQRNSIEASEAEGATHRAP